MFDEDNFEYTYNKWHIVMADGELTINDVSYERSDDDPTYDLVIMLAHYEFLGI